MAGLTQSGPFYGCAAEAYSIRVIKDGTEIAMDPITQFKEQQKAAWSNFAILENMTGMAAPRLVKFAGIKAGSAVLDVACGTGVVALSAARLGAKATGVDLTPELVARAKENAGLMNLDATWHEGDAEQLPVPDVSFDVVVSQFGHMFAPRPDVVIREMLRVLKPGGTIAFVTWPPELFTGRMFALTAKYSPPPPSGVSPPVQWGDAATIRERLGTAVKDITFARDAMLFPILSPQHFRLFMERNFGPAIKLFQGLDKSDPDKSAALRREVEDLAAQYFENNTVRQDYLLTRAVKV
jgi:SAM-dependent methyltransferase